MIKERKMSYSILLLSIFFFKFLYLFKLFEPSKYMMIYTREIGNLWNFDSFLNFKILLFFEIVKFGECLEFSEIKFLEFSKLQIF